MNSTENTCIDNSNVDQSTICNTYKVNMKPVKLDDSSTTDKPDVGDVLYSTSDGKLTLDTQTNGTDNIPIAICVIPDVMENFETGNDNKGTIRTARFVSLNYMSYKTPAIGSDDVQRMYFGNYGSTIHFITGCANKASYIGGKYETQKFLQACTKQNKDLTNGVANKVGIGYCAPACCCVAYSTPGTKPGDWYLPMPGELYQIYANKGYIDKIRTSIKGRGFINNSYWSSNECSRNTVCTISLGNGNIYFGEDKSEYNYVLAFLAVEY